VGACGAGFALCDFFLGWACFVLTWKNEAGKAGDGGESLPGSSITKSLETDLGG
jgi:hypothetical protein